MELMKCGGDSERWNLKRMASSSIRTRPDTRPPVADRWAGAEMRVLTLSKSIITDRRTNGPTDGRTKPLIELRVCN